MNPLHASRGPRAIADWSIEDELAIRAIERNQPPRDFTPAAPDLADKWLRDPPLFTRVELAILAAVMLFGAACFMTGLAWGALAHG